MINLVQIAGVQYMCIDLGAISAFVSSLGFFFNNSSVAAFMGAFFAFSLGLVTYDYTKRREKWKLHYDGIVKTERLINRHLNGISGNIFLLRGAIEAMEKGAFTENVLQQLEDPDYLTDVHNVPLLNVYFDYQALLEKCNHDMAAWNRSVDRLFNVALTGSVKPADIEINRKSLAERSKQIVGCLEDLIEEAYTTGAYVRKFIAVDKRDRFALLSRTEKIDLTPEQVAKERVKFVKESIATTEKDKKRTSKYKG